MQLLMQDGKVHFCSAVAVFFLFLTGCASKQPQGTQARADDRIQELKELVRVEVDDPQRAQAMLAILDEANSAVERQFEQMDAQLEQIEYASRQYDTSRAALEDMVGKMNEDTLKILEELEQAHFKIKQLATEEEWNAVVKQERKFLGLF